MYEVSVETCFCGAHRIKGYDGSCENIHGHNWRVRFRIKFAKTGELGMGPDFKTVKENAEKVVRELDHKDLNELEFFKFQNPTAENIAYYLFRAISSRLNTDWYRVTCVEVHETDSYMASYYEE